MRKRAREGESERENKIEFEGFLVNNFFLCFVVFAVGNVILRMRRMR